MERIAELLAQGLENLNAEELAELGELLDARFSELRDAPRTPESVDAATEVAGHIQALAGETARRQAEQDELDARMAALESQISGDPDGGDGDGDGGGEDPPAGDGDEPPDPEAATDEAEPAGEPVTAAAPVPPDPDAATQRPRVPAVPARHRPRPAPAAPELVITAAGDVPGFSAGSRMRSLDDVGRAFAGKVYALQRGKASGVFNVATFSDPAPAPRVSGRQAAEQNEVIVAAAMADHERAVRDTLAAMVASGQDALTAAGGLCAPAMPLYTFQQIAVADRPVTAALARVPATRGSVTFIPPANLTDLDAGITVHTVADDEASTTKPCVTITCGSPTTVEVDAIPLCITVGNFDRRTFPEHFANWYELGLAQHARIAEKNVLDKIDTNSTAITDGQALGAARDLLESWGRHAAARRQFFRMSPTAPVQLIAPAWVRDMIREDLLRQMAGDNTIGVSNEDINRWLAVRNILPVWALEGRTAGGQDFAAQVAGVAQAWRLTVESHMFHPGAHFFMDGGELNLGTEIRDSELNAVNNVQAWLETFEGTGFNGLWSSRIRNNVCVNGEAAGTVDLGCLSS